MYCLLPNGLAMLCCAMYYVLCVMRHVLCCTVLLILFNYKTNPFNLYVCWLFVSQESETPATKSTYKRKRADVEEIENSDSSDRSGAESSEAKKSKKKSKKKKKKKKVFFSPIHNVARITCRGFIGECYEIHSLRRGSCRACTLFINLAREIKFHYCGDR